MDTEVVTTRALEIWLGADNIIRSTPRLNINMTLQDALEGEEVISGLSKGGKLPRLCDYTNIRSQDVECRDFYAGPKIADACSACAIIIGSPISRIIGNFYMGLNKPKTPTRLFTIEAKAIAWLTGF